MLWPDAIENRKSLNIFDQRNDVMWTMFKRAYHVIVYMIKRINDKIRNDLRKFTRDPK